MRATHLRANNTQADVLQSRIVALQNEIRQMQEEGGVSSTVAARQAARAAQQEAPAPAGTQANGNAPGASRLRCIP